VQRRPHAIDVDAHFLGEVAHEIGREGREEHVRKHSRIRTGT
jgi:hypothetical protein